MVAHNMNEIMCTMAYVHVHVVALRENIDKKHLRHFFMIDIHVYGNTLQHMILEILSR